MNTKDYTTQSTGISEQKPSSEGRGFSPPLRSAHFFGEVRMCSRPSNLGGAGQHLDLRHYSPPSGVARS